MQQLLEAKAGMLNDAMKQPRTTVYVCGSGSMAEAVGSTLVEIIGRGAFQAMVEDGRYREDVFGFDKVYRVAGPLTTVSTAALLNAFS